MAWSDQESVLLGQEDAVLCPPGALLLPHPCRSTAPPGWRLTPSRVHSADRTIPIAWLRFQQALQQEVAAAADPDTMQHFAELLQLIELLCHARYSPDSRYLQSAMMLAQPQLSEEDRQLLGSLDGSCGAADDPQASAVSLHTLSPPHRHRNQHVCLCLLNAGV
jgi:hypothetical protein